jgi:hypothetical protein
MGRTDNMEIAVLAVPKPQIRVSDGGDWTDRMPEHDFLPEKCIAGLVN